MAGSERFHVASAQLDFERGSTQQTLERLAEHTRWAANDAARLAVLPECALTGCCFELRAEAREFAQTIPGPATEAVTAFCREHDVHGCTLAEADGESETILAATIE